MINCPLCGESVPVIEKHVDEVHSSIYCPTCKICSLKKHPETLCMGCRRVIGVQVKAEFCLEEVISSSTVSTITSNLAASSSAASSLTSSLPATPSTLLRVNSPKQPVQCYLCHQWFHNKDANISKSRMIVNPVGSSISSCFSSPSYNTRLTSLQVLRPGLQQGGGEEEARPGEAQRVQL